MTEAIQVGFQAFISDGGEELGAIRAIARDRRTIGHAHDAEES